jgi:hypothetical protein
VLSFSRSEVRLLHPAQASKGWACFAAPVFLLALPRRWVNLIAPIFQLAAGAPPKELISCYPSPYRPDCHCHRAGNHLGRFKACRCLASLLHPGWRTTHTAKSMTRSLGFVSEAVPILLSRCSVGISVFQPFLGTGTQLDPISPH